MENPLQKGCCTSSPRQPTRKPQVCPLAGHVTIKSRRQWVSSHPVSLTLCRVSVSASPARSPVFSHLASSLWGLWTIRAYKAEQRFQEVFDRCQDLHSGLYVSESDFKDGMCCLLRPDLPLRWFCCPAPLSMHPIVLLCTPASPTPSSQHPLSAPLFPSHMLCFSPLTALHCPSITVPCGFLSLEDRSQQTFFWQKAG